MISKSTGESIVVRSKNSPEGNSVAAIPGAFAEVKFDAHDSTFLMFYSACENPGCSCTDVVVTFSEKRSGKKPGHPHVEFGVGFWKHPPIQSPEQPPSCSIRSNGFTASLRRSQIRDAIVNGSTAPTPTAPGFPYPPRMGKAQSARQQNIPSRTIRSSPGKSAARGLA